MSYDGLEIELASIECEKAFLLEDAKYELERLGDTFYEEEEESSGLFGKIKKLIKTVKEWFSQHFGKKKELKVSKENAPKVKKAHSLLSKLKSNVKNPKVWAALIGLTAAGTILVTTGVTTKRMYDSKKEKSQIKKNSNTMENMVKVVDKNGGDTAIIGYFDAGEACDVIVDGLDRLYKNKEISYNEYRDRLRAINITLVDLYGELKKDFDENGSFKDINIKRALIRNQREAHALYKKKGAKPTDTGNKELMRMQSKMGDIDKRLRVKYDDSGDDIFDEK